MPAWLTWTAIKSLPWKYIGAAVAALTIAILIWRAPWAEHRQKAEDQAVIAAVTAQRDGYKANADQLKAALDQQNAAVAALKAEGDKRAADGKKALSDAQRANASLSETAEALRASAKRKVDATPCPISETLQKAGAI